MGKKSRRTTKNPGGKGPGKGPSYGGGGGGGNVLQRLGPEILERYGLPNPFTETTPAELASITSPHVESSDEHDPVKAGASATCWICLDGKDDSPEPLRRDCACRSDGQYVHLSCLIKYMTSRSDSIWTGALQIQKDANWLTCGRPWESCANCKQYYKGQLKYDIAREYCRATEGFVGGEKIVRHVMARSWLTKSLMEVSGGVTPEEIRLQFERLLRLIRDGANPIYAQAALKASGKGSIDFIFQYLESTVACLEYEAMTNYTQFNAGMLRYMKHQGGHEDEMRSIYQTCIATMNEALSKLDSINTKTHPPQQRELSRVQMQSLLAMLRAQFSYLESKPSTASGYEQKREAATLNRRLMEMMKEERPGYSESITYSIQHAQKLMELGCENPFEAVSILEEITPKALQTLGPTHHDCTCIKATWDSLLVNRQVFSPIVSDEPCPVIRCEGGDDSDDDMYILSSPDGGEVGCSPGEVILSPHALVKCVGLKGAKHLNGKRCWVAAYDKKTSRHSVKFEDTDLKACLVKAGNLRLLFFEMEEMLREKGVK
mmetsp:Transcript_24702/g.55885  ORF Transcript_24702/g.55885 Transcript_24702/m.55885 type:complete len:547 (+) Transcript_24702:420-2060(+)